MNAEFFRAFARRCRELMMRARSTAAREQLRVWAEEFDLRADAMERKSPNREIKEAGPK
jgi:hypothetical protein